MKFKLIVNNYFFLIPSRKRPVFCSKPKKNAEAKKNGIGRDNPITHDILDSFGKTLTGTGLSSPRASHIVKRYE